MSFLIAWIIKNSAAIAAAGAVAAAVANVESVAINTIKLSETISATDDRK
jgi:hypothetical protein